MNAEARHHLNLLEAVSENATISQRRLAATVGIALGLTNLYVKRLVRKGYLKCVNVQPNRLSYLITPAGLAEKTRLTYEFMEYSLRLYRNARSRLRTTLVPIAQRPGARIAIYGVGEGGELALTCLKELGVEPVAVFADTGGATFFSMAVRPVDEHASVAFDAVVVATLENPGPLLERLERLGISRSRLTPLRSV